MAKNDSAARVTRTAAIIAILTVLGSSISLLAETQPRSRRDLTGAAPLGARNTASRSTRAGPIEPTKAQQLVYTTIKDTLEITDEQWTILGPKIAKIVELQSDLAGSSGGVLIAYRVLGSGDFTALLAGRNPAQVYDLTSTDGAQTGSPALRDKIQKLQDALDRSDLPAAEVQQRLEAVRNARRQASQELEQAQRELVELLSTRQEAFLSQMGLLE